MADVISRVRETCAAAVASSPDVSIDDAAVDSFAAQIVQEVDGEHIVPPLNLPLRFRSVDEELNSWFLLQLMNIGSGFRDPLKAATGCGAWDTMLRGLLGMHISGVRINADLLNRADVSSIEMWFGFPVSVEVEIMPAVRQTKPGPLRPLAEHLVRLMNEAGTALRSRAHDDFASFLRAGAAAERARALASGAATAESWKPSAAAFVARVVEAFPGFRDVHTLRRSPAAAAAGSEGGAAAVAPAVVSAGAEGGAGAGAASAASAASAAAAGASVRLQQEVWILKKAQLAAAHLHRRFGGAGRMPEVFGFPADADADCEGSVARLTVMADNVLPAVLRAAGVLRYSPALAAAIDGGEPLPAGDREIDLRAAAVVASARLAAAVRARAAEALIALEAGAGAAPAAAAAAPAVSEAAASSAAPAASSAEAAAALAPDAASAGAADAATASLALASRAPQTASSLRRLACINEADLDEWLWVRGKEPELRKLRRHYTRDTYFY